MSLCVCLRTNLSDDLRLPRNILSRGSYASRSIYPAPILQIVNLRFGRRTNRKRRSWCGGNRGRRRTLDDRRRWSDGGGGGMRAIVGDGRRRGGPEGTVEPLRDTFLRHCFWGKMFGVSSCFLLLASCFLLLLSLSGERLRPKGVPCTAGWLGHALLMRPFLFSKISLNNTTYCQNCINWHHFPYFPHYIFIFLLLNKLVIEFSHFTKF